MLPLLAKLAPVLTGVTKTEDGAAQPVSQDFQWWVRLPLLVGFVLIMVGIFGPVTEDRRSDLYEAGLALVIGGPITYGVRRRQWQKAQAALPPVQPAPVDPPVVAPPQSDADAAKQIENL